MSKQHTIIAITGSSGAGTTFIKRAFEKIFAKKNLRVCVIEGDSFHKFERAEMKKEIAKYKAAGRVLTHFSDQANRLEDLAALFENYGKTGGGKKRYYIHSEEEADAHNKRLGTNLKAGQFTPWEDIEKNTDLMFYEGLHGGVRTKTADVASNVDLLVGVVPVINIEWLQKIHRDTSERPYTPAQVRDVILARMPDYVEFITPQFDNTHINFHRIPLIDTSNPFAEKARPPKPEESLVVTNIRIDGVNLEKIRDSLPKSADAFLQNPHTLVYRGDYMVEAVEKILMPLIDRLLATQSK